MKRYIGTKIIHAEPQEKDGLRGYKVRYPDGYTSWSPADVFEAAYYPTEGMTFGLAIEAMKAGNRVARAGWNGKGMWIALTWAEPRIVLAEDFWSPHARDHADENGGEAQVLPAILMKTADGSILMGWLASQTDMLADDWMIV